MNLFPGCVCRHTAKPESMFTYLGSYGDQAKLESRDSFKGVKQVLLVPAKSVFALGGDNPGQQFKASIQDVVNKRLYPTADPDPRAKPANPKQAYGDKKPPLQLIHSIALLHESAAMHAGKLKYGENNYIQADVEVMTYVGAIRRHLDQYIAGERVDAKELVHHLGAIRACCEILLVAEACGTLIDNRPAVWGDGAPRRAKAGRVPYGAAFKSTFEEVEKIIEHLNNLYPQAQK